MRQGEPRGDNVERNQRALFLTRPKPKTENVPLHSSFSRTPKFSTLLEFNFDRTISDFGFVKHLSFIINLETSCYIVNI